MLVVRYRHSEHIDGGLTRRPMSKVMSRWSEDDEDSCTVQFTTSRAKPAEHRVKSTLLDPPGPQKVRGCPGELIICNPKVAINSSTASALPSRDSVQAVQVPDRRAKTGSGH